MGYAGAVAATRTGGLAGGVRSGAAALAVASLAGGLATGVATWRRWIDPAAHRWVHHGWYGASVATGLLAAVGDPARRVGFLTGVLALAALPVARAGGTARTALALTAAGCYAATIRRSRS